MSKNLSKTEYEIMSELELRGLKHITLSEASSMLNINKDYLRVIFHRLVKKNWLERIEKGKYIIVPMAGKFGWSEHPFVTASRMVKKYYISYRTALSHYGLTEQIPRYVYVATLDRKAVIERSVHDYYFRFIKIRERKLFGYRKEKIESEEIAVAEIEKAIIDCLDKEQFAGTIIETAKALKDSRVNVNKLKRYAVMLNNASLIRRLGYLLDLFNLDSSGIEEHIGSFKYIYLSIKLPMKEISRSKKWRLIVNVRSEDLMEW